MELYQHPPEGSHVICLEEMGSVASKTIQRLVGAQSSFTEP